MACGDTWGGHLIVDTETAHIPRTYQEQGCDKRSEAADQAQSATM